MKNRNMHCRRAIVLTLAGFALSMTARAADGELSNQNTAEGHDALSSLTTGANNTAVGFDALFSITDGSEDTATGSLALANDTGGFNTAYGFSALNSNTTGILNTATGRNALLSNTTGFNNTATGSAALSSNTTGNFNVATGRVALVSNSTGSGNTANGFSSLSNNTTGEQNTANGVVALFNNTTGNTNIALGFQAGFNLTTGSNNIDIGNLGMAGESNHIRIGAKETHNATFIAGINGTTIASGVTVIIGPNGRLGTVTSSERFKDGIKPMDKASEAILALQPVTFRYKHELDPTGIPQFGLVAEQVEKVNPDLVARDDQGKVYTVRYEAVNAMLLNEFLKEHRKVEEQEATITQVKSAVANQETTIAQQQKEIKALTGSLKEQASQIQKVSDQLELSKPALQVALNNQ
jgi:uncharacterized coiled-coil protein SlyX